MSWPPHRPTRRFVLRASAALVLVPSCNQNSPMIDHDRLTRLEAATGGRLGVSAVNLGSGKTLVHRGNERFAFCSTFKWLLGALVLAKVDAGTELLTTQLSFGPDDILSHSPVLSPAVNRGTMSLAELCEATITTSDNAAANLLIKHLGGPAALTAQLREFGDEVTRFDRYELELNEAAPGDPRDTTSPNAMRATMERFLFGDALSDQSRRLLRRWMIDAVTGFSRLRAGIPEGWVAGDKTGTNLTNMNNNLAFAIPPDGAQADTGPVLITSFIDAPHPFSEERNNAHAEIARMAFAEL